MDSRVSASSLKIKALGFLETSGITHAKTQRHTSEDLSPKEKFINKLWLDKNTEFTCRASVFTILQAFPKEAVVVYTFINNSM